ARLVSDWSSDVCSSDLDGGAHRHVVERIGADVVVLDVDAVERHRRKRTAQSVDGSDIAARGNAGLSVEEITDLAAEQRQVLDLGDRKSVVEGRGEDGGG